MTTYHIERINEKVETIKVNGYFVHSKYNPIKEANRIIEQKYKPHAIHLLFGWGLGYVYETFEAKKQFDEEIYIIDPIVDSGSLEISNEVNYIKFDEDNLDRLFTYLDQKLNREAKEIQIILTPNYDKVCSTFYKELLQRVKLVQESYLIYENTKYYNSVQWEFNRINNVRNLLKSINTRSLEAKYDTPVVIASGGPSLTKQLPIVRKYRDKIILVASGSTITTLMKEGIEPDYILSLDGDVVNYHLFKPYSFKKAKLIYLMTNHPFIPHVFKTSHYITERDGGEVNRQYLKRNLGIDIPMLAAGPSVANLALSFAIYITSAPIALIGQDLAFTNDLSHALGNVHTTKVTEAEHLANGHYKVKGYNGFEVWTSPSMYAMKENFEKQILYFTGVDRVYNCTEGGASINGMKQMPFEQFCMGYLPKHPITIIEPKEDEYINFDLEKLLQGEIKIYRKLIGYCLEGLKVLSSNSSSLAFTQPTLAKLEKVESNVQKLLSQLPIAAILEPIQKKILKGYLPKVNETNKEAYERVYNQTKVFYTDLVEVIKLVKRLTEEAIIYHIEQENKND